MHCEPIHLHAACERDCDAPSVRCIGEHHRVVVAVGREVGPVERRVRCRRRRRARRPRARAAGSLARHERSRDDHRRVRIFGERDIAERADVRPRAVAVAVAPAATVSVAQSAVTSAESARGSVSTYDVAVLDVQWSDVHGTPRTVTSNSAAVRSPKLAPSS